MGRMMDVDGKRVMQHFLTVCATCCKAGEASQGLQLAQELRGLFSASEDADIRAFEVSTVECMSACAEPIALSFRASGKTAYLFSEVTLQEHLDILAFARLYLDSMDGVIADARPCGRLRHCLRGRIPAAGMIIPPSE